jgi:SAM-dependent methyltransferase
MKTTCQQLYEKEQFVPSLFGVFLNPYFFIRKGISEAIISNAEYMKGRLLDFGCGSKPYKSLINVHEYIGLDIEQVGHSHKNEQIDVYYDGKNIPFADNHFDVVFSSEVFEHIFNIEEIIFEIHRVLKANGHLLITLPFVWDEHEIPFDFARYTSFGIRHLLEKRGFKIIKLMKTGNYVEVIFQLLAAYVNQSILPLKARKILSPLFVAPIIIAGLVLAKILPKNSNLFLNNVVLAQKLPQVGN